MKIAAVVCEYNPFHLGHQYQLDTVRRLLNPDAIVGIMSGHFVQRGEPAVFSKQSRAAAAIKCGVDLVLELPAVLTLQSAQRYARNAIQTLHALGCVNTLFFGAESPDTEVLVQIAHVLANEDAVFSRRLQEELRRGLSFASARAFVIKTILGPASASILSQPNNILAVEYIKELLHLQSDIQPFAIARRGAGHDAAVPADGFASASALREMLSKGQDIHRYLPPDVSELFALEQPFSVENMEKELIANLCLMPLEVLRQTADVSEGLEHALKQAAFSADTLPQLISLVKSKRYAYSRIRRIVLNAYLGITQKDTQLLPSYIRVLDFNETGQKILNLARKTASLPLAKNGGQIKNLPDAQKLWRRELALDRVYALFQNADKKI